jgi:hypothetical protein
MAGEGVVGDVTSGDRYKSDKVLLSSGRSSLGARMTVRTRTTVVRTVQCSSETSRCEGGFVAYSSRQSKGTLHGHHGVHLQGQLTIRGTFGRSR